MALKRCGNCEAMVGTACKRCSECGEAFRPSKKNAKTNLAIDLCKRMLLSACRESIARFADMLESIGDEDCKVIRSLYNLEKENVVDVFFGENDINYVLYYYKDGLKVVRSYPEEVDLGEVKTKIVEDCESFLTEKHGEKWKEGHLCVIKFAKNGEIFEKKFLSVTE